MGPGQEGPQLIEKGSMGPGVGQGAWSHGNHAAMGPMSHGRAEGAGMRWSPFMGPWGGAGGKGGGKGGKGGGGGHALGPFKVSLSKRGAWGEGAWSHGTIGPWSHERWGKGPHIEKSGIGPVG